MEPILEDGSPLYSKKVSANNAAAARALDDIQYQSTGQLHPRICQEPPLSSLETSIAATEIGKNAVIEGEDSKDEEGVSSSEGGSTIDESKVILEHSGSSGEAPAIITRECDPLVDEQEETVEYVLCNIESIPQQRPYERILDALSNSKVQLSGKPGTWSSQPVSNPTMPTGSELWPFERLSETVKAVNSWVDSCLKSKANQSRNSRNPHRVVLGTAADSAQKAALAKGLLERLAQANQHAPMFSRDIGVERAAERIMEILWEADAVDADVYSSYLLCFTGPSPQDVANRVESIVEAMSSGCPIDGRALPQPNTRVINSLIKVWAQLGGTAGRYSKNLDNFEPNRDSFLSLLSSSSYLPVVQEEGELLYSPTFDVEFAQQCVNRMKELAETKSSLNAKEEASALRPDSQVYNAPMRWSGGAYSINSRPAARLIPFDKYDSLFGGYNDGFPMQDIPPTDQVIAMDEWRKVVETEGMATIETHEAMIQGWVRTRSLKGLKHAEEVALKLLNDSESGSRLQTFQPIIAAWLHAGHDHSMKKVVEWYDLLEEGSKKNPALRPDGRLLEVLIAASAAGQLKLMSKRKGGPSHIRAECEEIANSSLERLKISCDRLENALLEGGDDYFLEIGPFIRCVYCWNNVVHAKLPVPTDEELDRTIRSLCSILDLFERTVQVTCITDRVTLDNTDIASLQLVHFLENGHNLFMTLMTALSQCNAALQEKCMSNDPLSKPILRLVERMLKRTGEFVELEAKIIEASEEPYVPRSARLCYGDMFLYWNKERGFIRRNRTPYLWQVLTLLRSSNPKEVHRRDLIRICDLLQKVSSAHFVSVKLRMGIDEQLRNTMWSGQEWLTRGHPSVKERKPQGKRRPRAKVKGTTAR